MSEKNMWYQHQQKLIDENPNKRLVAFGCGAGKTRTILQLCKQHGGERSPVTIVAPKTQVLDKTWEREQEKTGIKLNVSILSKEQFKLRKPADCEILVLDESHFFVGVLPATRRKKGVEYPRTSILFDEVIRYIEEKKPRVIYLASATPFPQPMALYAVARIFGEKWDFFKFRNVFYVYVPRIGRGVWVPRRDAVTKEKMLKYAGKFGSFGRLQDFFDVPEQTHKDVFVGMSVEQKAKAKDLPLFYPDPLVLVGKRHQLEQGIFEGEPLPENKTHEIVELAKEFEKIVVFVRYKKQIEHLREVLDEKTKHMILVLDGETKDRRELFRLAEETDKCIVIAQAQISTGYELPSFRCTVFASQSYSFVDYEQALGRTLRANGLAKNVYVHLLAGPVDKAVLSCVRDKRDFNEALYGRDETTKE